MSCLACLHRNLHLGCSATARSGSLQGTQCAMNNVAANHSRNNIKRNASSRFRESRPYSAKLTSPKPELHEAVHVHQRIDGTQRRVSKVPEKAVEHIDAQGVPDCARFTRTQRTTAAQSAPMRAMPPIDEQSWRHRDHSRWFMGLRHFNTRVIPATSHSLRRCVNFVGINEAAQI
jgi:hypothetical protein